MKAQEFAQLSAGMLAPDDAGPAKVRAFEDWLAEKARHPYRSQGGGGRCASCGLLARHMIHGKGGAK